MQLTFLERKVSQRTLRRAARLSANASFAPAPNFSRVSGCPLASALNSRRVAARDNSRQRTAAKRRACAKEKRTCAPGAERSERKSFLMKLFFKKVSTLPLTFIGAQRRKESQGNSAAFFPAGGVPPLSIRGPVPGLSIRAPWQLAIARAHQAASARPRPSAWAVNSRPWQLAIARAHRTASARPRPSAWAVNSRRVAARDNSRPGAVSYAHACASRQRTCAPGVMCGTPAVLALYILQGPP